MSHILMQRATCRAPTGHCAAGWKGSPSFDKSGFVLPKWGRSFWATPTLVGVTRVGVGGSDVTKIDSGPDYIDHQLAHLRPLTPAVDLTVKNSRICMDHTYKLYLQVLQLRSVSHKATTIAIRY